MTAPYVEILAAVQTLVDGLELTYQGGAITTNLSKLPEAQETLDTLPAVAIVPSTKPERDEPYAFGYRELEFTVDVVAIGAGNSALNNGLTDVLTIRDQISAAFEGGGQTLAVTGLYKTSIEYDVPIDRAKVSQQYDYSGLRLIFVVIRPSGA